MKTFDELLKETKEYGVVNEVKFPIIKCSGLPNVRSDDLVIFETGQHGYVTSLDQDKVEIVTFSRDIVRPGVKVVRTGERLSIPVDDRFLGKVVTPLIEPIFHDDLKIDESVERRPVDIEPIKIDRRVRITRQLYTGVSLVDVMLPLGKGQRELVVGDRQTGKTWTLLNFMKTQVKLDSIVIYALIGKEKTEIARMKDFLTEAGMIKNVIVIATSSDDSPSLITLTPYSAMTMAEYFRDNGKDVLVILDDLTTHAMYHREISLLAMRFPGRDSYPGDVFFKHARLLERAGNYNVNGKEAAISCLSVAGTINNRLTGYIVSNLIGITDGHLLFDTELFNRGQRPSIDLFLSVTRVGKQTQHKIARALNRELMMMMSKYEEALDFSHFGAELSDEKKSLLARGEKVMTFFQQNYTQIIPHPVQVLILTMLYDEQLEDVSEEDIIKMRDAIVDKYNKEDGVRKQIDDLMENSQNFKDYKEKVKSFKSFFNGLWQQQN